MENGKWPVLSTLGYCSISFNSAGPMTRYRPAEILVSALSEFGRDKARNSAVQRRRPQILLYWDCDHQTVSALEKIARYNRYISAILKAAWRVTAELNEIVQYLRPNLWIAILGCGSRTLFFRPCHLSLACKLPLLVVSLAQKFLELTIPLIVGKLVHSNLERMFQKAPNNTSWGSTLRPLW